MNSKTCKMIRSAMRHVHNVDPRHRVYRTHETARIRLFWMGELNPDGTRLMVPFRMNTVRLAPGSGRLLYKRAKREMKRAKGAAR